MQATKSSLAALGLPAAEAQLYLAGLPRPGASLQDLCRATGLKRGTAYRVLRSLTEQGLAAEKKVSNKSLFTMAEPEGLRTILERQRERVDARMGALNALLPSLLRVAGTGKTEDVSVTQHHGIEGMKAVVDAALYCKSRHWDIIAPVGNFLRDHDPDYARKYLRARRSHRITARTLWERKPGARKLTPEEIRWRNPRFMPAAMRDKFPSMLILFDDKVALFSSYQKKSALLITSKEIHGMFAAMFEALWEAGEEYA